MDIDDLVKLSGRAWAIPILAHLHKGVPGRQATLLRATGAARSALGHSLDHLIDLKLLARNSGHGHPLRPEYVLTDKGHIIAKRASQITDAVPDRAGFQLIRRSWTLPVLALSQAPTGFSDIKGRLGGVTDRALSQALQALVAHNWMAREINNKATPIRPIYAAQNAGQMIGGFCGVRF